MVNFVKMIGKNREGGAAEPAPLDMGVCRYSLCDSGALLLAEWGLSTSADLMLSFSPRVGN